MSRFDDRRVVALALLLGACHPEVAAEPPSVAAPRVGTCPTPPGWTGCVAAEVSIAAPPERVWYTLPFGWFSPLVDHLYVQPRIRRTLREAHRRFAQHFGLPPPAHRPTDHRGGAERPSP